MNYLKHKEEKVFFPKKKKIIYIGNERIYGTLNHETNNYTKILNNKKAISLGSRKESKISYKQFLWILFCFGRKILYQ